MADTVKRSLLKSISWRIVATLITMSVVFVATGQLTFAATIGLFDMIIKFIVYFFHERIWNRFKYGTK